VRCKILYILKEKLALDGLRSDEMASEEMKGMVYVLDNWRRS